MRTENAVIIIAGPTASGKSSLALDLANALDGVVINADSMQVYQGTPIISAVPSAAEKAKVPHRLYEIYPPCKNGTVVEWLDLAVKEIKNCWQEQKLPVLVGGTGLYIDNLVNGTTPVPGITPQIRAERLQLLQQGGSEKMHRLVATFDPETAARLSPNDSSRVGRAWEVFRQTGIPLSQWHAMPLIKKLPQAKFITIKILPPKKELDERCYLRFNLMMQQGALEEVRKLDKLGLPEELPAMKMLGVPELRQYLNGKVSLEAAVELGKLHTRQYAKRQRTWFANKLSAMMSLNECYKNQEVLLKNIINDVKKEL